MNTLGETTSRRLAAVVKDAAAAARSPAPLGQDRSAGKAPQHHGGFDGGGGGTFGRALRLAGRIPVVTPPGGGSTGRREKIRANSEGVPSGRVTASK